MTSAEKTVMAYVEQATMELAKHLTFSSESHFKQWVDNNFTLIVEKAKSLQEQTVHNLLDDSSPQTKTLKKLMTVKVHSELNKGNAGVQSHNKAKIKSILSYDDNL
jgi:hypothetical protein